MERSISRRSLVVKGGGLTAAALLMQFPGARLIAAQGAASYSLIDLGAFDQTVTQNGVPGSESMVLAVNDQGVVCGRIAVSEEKFSPAIWSLQGKLTRLKSGKLGGQVQQVNAAGVAVGRQWYLDSNGTPINRPVVWTDGEPALLEGDAPDWPGQAIGINDDGIILGSLDSIGAVRWVDGVVEPVEVAPNAATLRPIAINQDGAIFGSYKDGAAYIAATVVGSEYRIASLPDGVAGFVAYNDLYASAFNNQGHGVISTGFMDPLRFFAVLVDGETTTVVDAPEGYQHCVLFDLNDDDTAVGYLGQEETGNTAVLWKEGEFTDLNDLVSASGLVLTIATGINNDGIVVGEANDADDVRHGVILIPA
ncbi:MAG: hypothetical protein IT334_02250 [Thermomicrobiales bacterium]|nr:hypothetical protein [Thermomicrobiales bacterium]